MIMRNWIVYNILCIFLTFISSLEVEKKVSICFGQHTTSEFVINFCNIHGGELVYRCCRSNDNATFVAIDLMESNLTEVPDFSLHENLNLSVIDLRLNPDLLPSHDNDFLTLTNLNDLILPEQMDCPGGLHAWETINQTTDPSGTRCMNQKDVCVNSTNLCTEKNSLCSTNGPNHFLCLCTDGYHDYKCLRYGTFPTAVFIGSAFGATILASALLYWTQRRHVLKK